MYSDQSGAEAGAPTTQPQKGLRELLEALSSEGSSGEVSKIIEVAAANLGRSYPLDSAFPKHIGNALRVEASCSGTAPSATAACFSLHIAAASGNSYVRGVGGIVQRMVKPIILAGDSGTGKSAPIAKLSKKIEHNMKVLMQASHLGGNDDETDGSSSGGGSVNGALIHLQQVAKRTTSDTWQDLFDTGCAYDADKAGAKRLKALGTFSQNVVQINDEFEDFHSMCSSDKKAVPKLLEFFNGGDSMERATLGGGVRTLQFPLITSISAGHPPTIQSKLFSEAFVTNGLAARMNVVQVPATSRSESRMVSVPANETYPLDYTALALQIVCTTDCGREAMEQFEPRQTFAQVAQGGPSRAAGSESPYFTVFELSRFAKGSQVLVQIPCGQEPGLKFHVSPHGGVLEGNNANLNMKGAVVPGGPLDIEQIDDRSVLVEINKTEVSTAQTALDVIRHLSAFGSATSKGEFMDAMDDCLLEVCDAQDMFAFLPPQNYKTIKAGDLTGPDAIVVEDFDGDGTFSAGIRVQLVPANLADIGIGVGFELHSCVSPTGDVTRFGGDFFKRGASEIAKQMAAQDSELSFQLLPLFPALELKFRSLSKEYSMTVDYHNNCADLMVSLSSSCNSGEIWCKALIAKLAKVPGIFTRELGVARAVRLGDEIVRGAKLERRGLGMASVETVLKLQAAWLARCKHAGTEPTTALKGTPQESLIPACLKFAICPCDVRAAVSVLDHDLTTMAMLLMSEVAGGPIPQRRASVFSMGQSPARTLLISGSVTPSVRSKMYKAVLVCKGADRASPDVPEGRWGEARYLAAALVTNSVRSARDLKGLFPKANSNEFVALGQEMVNKKLISNLHAHQNTALAGTRRLWFELRDVNKMTQSELVDFSVLLKDEAQMSLLEYKTARMSEVAKPSGENPAAATVQAYAAYRWPGPCCLPHPSVCAGINYGTWACSEEGKHTSVGVVAAADGSTSSAVPSSSSLSASSGPSADRVDAEPPRTPPPGPPRE